MATSNFDKWELERIEREADKAREAERERMRSPDACGHLKYEALELSLEDPSNSNDNTYAHYVKHNIDAYFIKNGFPERLLRVSFASFVERGEQDKKTKSRLLAYSSEMKQAKRISFQTTEYTGIFTPSIALYGPPGTGKTFIAVCIAKEAAWMGHKSMYTTVSSLAREVRSTFRRGSDSSEEAILAKYSKTPLLVMDEIGAGTGSDHERAMFTDVISERYNSKRPTILISNLNLKDFKEALGERVTDRMSEDGGFILPVLGESRRRA